MKLAIIVPYRDRRDEMDIFIPHMEEFLSNKQIDYKIFIAEQSDDRPFNYGKLCNAVFNEIKDEYDYFCFHDIDLLPTNDTADYFYKDKPTQIVFENEYGQSLIPYNEYFGGVVIFCKEDFIKVNGYSNDYWGKGYVDLDLLYRCMKNNISLVKMYDYSENKPFHLDLKYRNISKDIPKIRLSDHSIIRTNKTNILAEDHTISFHYKQKQLFEDKIVLIRTFNGFDFQIFTCKDEMILQFFDADKELVQLNLKGIILERLNHYTFTHNYGEKIVNGYYNGELMQSIYYDNGYKYSKKNVILGDMTNNEEISLYDFKIFNYVLNEYEVKKNYYYGIDADCLDFKNISYFINMDTILDKKFNVWSLERDVFFDTKIKRNLNKEKYLPNRIKGQFRVIGNKHNEIENTFDPDILANRYTYTDDLLSGKINIKKYGLKSVKYTLLNRIEFNNNTEWLRMAI